MLFDTNIAIFLQDRRVEIWQRFIVSEERPSISLVTLIELEGGIVVDPEKSAARREALDDLLRVVDVLPLDQLVVHRYADILKATGFSRGRVLDRLIAATAMVHDLTLATTNGPDFANIPGLKLEIWPRPAQ